jgi:hypothetical protein
MSRALPFAALLLACGSSGNQPTDGGNDVIYGHKPVDAGAPDVPEAEAAAKMPWNRMSSHNGVVLAAPHLRAIYVGTAADLDAFITWMVASTDYWGAILAQYGVSYGTFDGSTRVDQSAFFLPGQINSGIISWSILEKRIADVIHQQPQPDAGSSDAGGDGGEAGATLPPIPAADGYIFFLPDGVQVDLGGGSMTCAGVGGYHSWDGQEPYSIIPSCGRNHIVVSHEIAEMVTDPEPGAGWFSDTDQLGEIGDLCNYKIDLDGTTATALWSNKDGDCELQ